MPQFEVQVQPITTVQLSPLEAGIVERLVVEEGTSVKKGDVLVVLSNTSLTLEILNSEAELAEKQNILRGDADIVVEFTAHDQMCIRDRIRIATSVKIPTMCRMRR